MTIKDLIEKWRKEAVECETKATKYDHQRNLNSKYYSSMTEVEKRVWDDLRDAAYHLRIERDVLNACALALERIGAA